MGSLFVEVLASLVSVVNPFGAVPVFLAMTSHFSDRFRSRTIRNATFYFILILMSFFFVGKSILGFFGIGVSAMKIAGGLVILRSGYDLLQGKGEKSKARNKEELKEIHHDHEDISFSPLALPVLAGPGSISYLIGQYAEHDAWNERFTIAGVILVTGLIVFLTLRFAPYLYRNIHSHKISPCIMIFRLDS